MQIYLENVDVPRLLDTVETCAEKVSLFENIVKSGLDLIIPLRSKTIYPSEPPWLNDKLKNLIKRRQCALAKGNMVTFRTLRNCVNRERKICRAKYYEAKVSHLRECKPSVWWKEVKKLSGMSPASETRNDTSKLLQHLGFSPGDLANYINSAFLSPMQCFEPLSNNPFDPPQTNNESHAINTISEFSTFMKLSALNPSKAQGPDGIPVWLLKENADLLAGPVSVILNSSFHESRLPPSWKEADVVPVPKQRPINDINKHLRPISLTPILSKLAEDHIVEKYVKPAVLQRIDPRQFGTIPKSSTTHALVNMTHNWLVNTDGNGATARVVLLDFRKAFDLIDHSVLVQELTTFAIPSQVKSWIVDFLMDRKQRVKLAQDCHSEWRSVPSGVPQGTKLGPWLFLVMINDLDTPADMWKYVDDTSCSEIVRKGSESKLQEAVDDLSRQASIDGFQLNEAKCKEIRIGFSSNNHDFEPLVLNGKPLEVVTSAKLLGMIISHDLKWNMHTSELSRKCSSRLYFLRQLKRSGVAPSELVLFYMTCIRPVLEYACPVFHRSIPTYISEDLERIQRRALGIIYPDLSYSVALETAGLPKLHERRGKISTDLFDEIVFDPTHRLHSLLPQRKSCKYALRCKSYFSLLICKTERLKNSFIFSRVYKM